MQKEIFHNAVPDPELEKLLSNGSVLCFTATPGEKPVYDDEPRTAKEVDAQNRHSYIGLLFNSRFIDSY